MRDDTPNIIASAAITLPLATLALIARLVARKITKAGYGIDDAFAVVGWLGSLALLTNGMIWIKDGLGKPMEVGLTDDFTFHDKNRLAWIHMWTTSFTYTFAIAFSKFAILAFYWRLFQFSDIRIPIQVLSCITVAWFLLRLFMVCLQCLPLTALWDGDQATRDAKCHIRESTFFFSTVLTHVLIDCAILILPAIEIGKLHLPKGQKVAVIALFAFGAMTCLASIFVLVESFKFKSDSKEMTLQMGQHYAWSIAECNFAVIAGMFMLNTASLTCTDFSQLVFPCFDQSHARSSQAHSSPPTAAVNQPKSAPPSAHHSATASASPAYPRRDPAKTTAEAQHTNFPTTHQIYTT
ncbi:hypothetical protein FOMG_08694 [Fusarium oxysporum f. sp. melonis 26406]|uniref:Rhodopsin domain-containing protein n=1 Tax=Fusarium oxysporum f. sp. melonis 26406 TaxID=1089452 RepID=X0A2D0_FUSOX|nr:hypothetical protein FOMG_08694 [Fusarium oxysporum f. sp. melonis 26406]